MKKLFIVLICVGMVAGIGIGGFMMLQTLGQEQGQEQTRQEQNHCPGRTLLRNKEDQAI